MAAQAKADLYLRWMVEQHPETYVESVGTERPRWVKLRAKLTVAPPEFVKSRTYSDDMGVEPKERMGR